MADRSDQLLDSAIPPETFDETGLPFRAIDGRSR